MRLILLSFWFFCVALSPWASAQIPPTFVLPLGADPSSTALRDWTEAVWPILLEVISPRRIPARVTLRDQSGGQAYCEDNSIAGVSNVPPYSGGISQNINWHLGFTHEMIHILSNCGNHIADDPFNAGYHYRDGGLNEGYATAATKLIWSRLGYKSSLRQYFTDFALNYTNPNFLGGGHSSYDTVARGWYNYQAMPIAYSNWAVPYILIAQHSFGGSLKPIDEAVANFPDLLRDQYFDAIDLIGLPIDGAKSSTPFRRSPGYFRYGSFGDNFAIFPWSPLSYASATIYVHCGYFTRISYSKYPQYVTHSGNIQWILSNANDQKVANGTFAINDGQSLYTLQLPPTLSAGSYKLSACVANQQGCMPGLSDTTFIGIIANSPVWDSDGLYVVTNGPHFSDWGEARIVDDGGATLIEIHPGAMIFVGATRDIILDSSSGRRIFTPIVGGLRIVYLKERDIWPDQVTTRKTLVLPARGTVTATTLNGKDTPVAGYAKVDVDQGSAPYGTAVFGFKQNGATVSETGVPASPPTTAARIFIDHRSGVAAIPGRVSAGTVNINTGIAVVNCDSASNGSSLANLTYTLRNIAGATIASGHGTLATGAHFAKFIDQLNEVAPDFILPANFQMATQFASLDISSDRPLSILALRMTTNQRNEVLFTTTPIADLTKPVVNGAIFFPQFADGDGYTSSIILLNTSNQSETGTLEILDDNGNPFAIQEVGGTIDSIFRYAIANGGAARFQSNGLPPKTKVGWVRLTPDGGTSTPVGAGVFGYNPDNCLVTESGISATLATTHARVYVDLSGGHNTGLAIANPTNTNAGIAITAFQNDGATGMGTSQDPLQVPANGHSAHFADELVAGLPAGFTGVLDISSPIPFAALTMRSLYNERNDFLLATFPIAGITVGAPAPIVFPQIADGGGYVTQFILIGAGGTSSVILYFYGEDGKPLAVAK